MGIVPSDEATGMPREVPVPWIRALLFTRNQSQV